MWWFSHAQPTWWFSHAQPMWWFSHAQLPDLTGPLLTLDEGPERSEICAKPDLCRLPSFQHLNCHSNANAMFLIFVIFFLLIDWCFIVAIELLRNILSKCTQCKYFLNELNFIVHCIYHNVGILDRLLWIDYVLITIIWNKCIISRRYVHPMMYEFSTTASNVVKG